MVMDHGSDGPGSSPSSGSLPEPETASELRKGRFWSNTGVSMMAIGDLDVETAGTDGLGAVRLKPSLTVAANVPSLQAYEGSKLASNEAVVATASTGGTATATGYLVPPSCGVPS